MAQTSLETWKFVLDMVRSEPLRVNHSTWSGGKWGYSYPSPAEPGYALPWQIV